MWTVLAGVVVLAGVAAVAFLAWNWLRARGARVVTCPDNHQPAGVEVAAAKAALAGLLGGRHLELKSCSRWPEKQGCGQDCLSQIRSSADGCLVGAMLAHWYAGKNCAVCGQPFGTVVWSERRPALKTPDGRSLAWKDVAPAALPSVLSTHAPICFNCYVAESFRETYPDLVIDRSLERRGNHPAD